MGKPTLSQPFLLEILEAFLPYLLRRFWACFDTSSATYKGCNPFIFPGAMDGVPIAAQLQAGVRVSLR